MKSNLYIILLFISVSAYTVPDSLRSEAKRINDLLINCNFGTARIISDSLLVKDSTEPLYYYLKLASLGLETLDRDEVVREKEFRETYKRGMALLAQNSTLKENTYLMMLQGFMQTSLSSFNLLSGKYFSAVSVGKDGLRSVEAARNIDSSNHDLDYYLGFFSYARGELKKRVPILFWLENSSKAGIVQLQRCSDHGQFMNSAADMVLVDVLVREGNLEKGEVILKSMMNEYQKSRFLLWTKTRLETAQKNPQKAAETFMTLARSYFKDQFFHNGIITALEAIKMVEDDRNLQRKYALEVSEILPKLSVPDKDRSRYKKIMKYCKE